MRYFILFLIFFSIGCASTFVPHERPVIKFDKTVSYEPVFIKKPPVPDIILLDKDQKPIPEDDNVTEVSYMALVQSEFNKITALNAQYNAQGKVIKDQGDLINLHINTINYFKELYELKNLEIQQYEALWTNSENAYRKEKEDNFQNNILNKTLIMILSISLAISVL